MKRTILVKGMSCRHCVKAVTEILSAFAGVAEIEVDLKTGAVSFTAAAEIDLEALSQNLDEAGYELA
ncbi:MAG TPA: heavy-metal-associated domain-containing protein [Proteobacteria bacterium]|nr:heavy-metal-associated domain-containing protein [Pseudomonadota bacterium]